jgi:hypothetical protein
MTTSIPAKTSPSIPDYPSMLQKLRASLAETGIPAGQHARTRRTIERMEADIKASEIEQKIATAQHDVDIDARFKRLASIFKET